MKQRSITGLFMIIGVALILTGASFHPIVLKLFGAVIAFFGSYELFRAGGYEKRYPILVPTMVVAAAIPLIPIPLKTFAIIMCPVYVACFIGFAILMRRHTSCHVTSPWQMVLLSLMVALFAKSFAEHISLGHGIWYVVLNLVVSAFADIFAYLTGRLLGRHKLAPLLSPHKTIEGSLGGLVFSVIMCVAYGWIYIAAGGAIHWLYLIIFAIIGAVISEFGDLAFSCIKRITGIKDYGTIFPGHGGFLDRGDSLLFLSPFALILFCLIGPALV